MNLKKMITATLSLLAVVSVVGCSNNKSSKSGVNNKTEQKADPNQTKRSLKAKYGQIKVGYQIDIFKNKKFKKIKGSTYKEVKEILGEPDSVQTSKYEDVITTSYMWRKKEGTIDVEFQNGRAVNKYFNVLKSKDKHEITVKEFSAVKVGSSYANIIKKLGKPTTLSEYISYDGKKKDWVEYEYYNNNKKNGNNQTKDSKIFILKFINNKLASKYRYNSK